MQVVETAIQPVKILTPKKHGNARGFFSETYNRAALEMLGLDFAFVKDDHTISAAVVPSRTLSGLHFPTAPCAQDKPIRVGRGRILDVAVDIRRSSPTFGRWVALELPAESWRQLLIPIGFAHGLIALQPDTEVLYKTTANYLPAHGPGVAWDDLDMRLKWPLPSGGPVLSDKNKRLRRLSDAPDLFD